MPAQNRGRRRLSFPPPRGIICLPSTAQIAAGSDDRESLGIEGSSEESSCRLDLAGLRRQGHAPLPN